MARTSSKTKNEVEPRGKGQFCEAKIVRKEILSYRRKPVKPVARELMGAPAHRETGSLINLVREPPSNHCTGTNRFLGLGAGEISHYCRSIYVLKFDQLIYTRLSKIYLSLEIS